MATDIEEFESEIMLVYNAYKGLKEINSNHSLLSFIELSDSGFKPTKKYYKRYVFPYLERDNRQLFLWKEMYPNQFQAKFRGLIEYNKDLHNAIKREVYERGLDKIFRVYLDTRNNFIN
jgi:hypothetical protein